MRGVGEAMGAITIVNALVTGIGSAAGIRWGARAEIELHPAGSRERWDVEVADVARTPLVVCSLEVALSRLAPGSSGTGRLEVRSDIPPSRGLKSSSAVSAAVIESVARATGARAEAIDVARLSAEASRRAGLSATGAFDDALAGLSAGVVVTDNRTGQLLRTDPLPSDLEVSLVIPAQEHRPSPEWAARFTACRDDGRAAGDAALAGDWPRAMRLNSELVERLMGYDYARARGAAEDAGATACGVSGMGPTLAAVVPRARTEAVAAALASVKGERRSIAFSRPREGGERVT